MEARLRVDTSRTRIRPTRAHKEMAPEAKDVMEMSDKTEDYGLFFGLCAFAGMGSAGFDQPSPEGQETIINCSLQLDSRKQQAG